MIPLPVATHSILTIIGLSLGYVHLYHPPPRFLYTGSRALVPMMLPLTSVIGPPYPASDTVGHCLRLWLPLVQNTGVIDQVPHAGIIYGVHHTVVTPH